MRHRGVASVSCNASLCVNNARHARKATIGRSIHCKRNWSTRRHQMGLVQDVAHATLTTASTLAQCVRKRSTVASFMRPCWLGRTRRKNCKSCDANRAILVSSASKRKMMREALTPTRVSAGSVWLCCAMCACDDGLAQPFRRCRWTTIGYKTSTCAAVTATGAVNATSRSCLKTFEGMGENARAVQRTRNVTFAASAMERSPAWNLTSMFCRTH